MFTDKMVKMLVNLPHPYAKELQVTVILVLIVSGTGGNGGNGGNGGRNNVTDCARDGGNGVIFGDSCTSSGSGSVDGIVGGGDRVSVILQRLISSGVTYEGKHTQ